MLVILLSPLGNVYPLWKFIDHDEIYKTFDFV